MAIVRLECLGKLKKNPMTLSRFETAIFRLVPWRLSQLRVRYCVFPILPLFKREIIRKDFFDESI
jgi:hypothetical protein